MTEIAHTRRFFDRLVAPKRMVILEGASHMPTEQPGVAQMEAAIIDFLHGIERGE
jgi:pimeloyl-ACP methyl ester carboxylesterase